MSKFGDNEKILPLLAPADIVATATPTQYFDLNLCSGIAEIAISFGTNTSTDAAGGATITLTANDVSDTSSSDSTETAIAFQYRVSAAVATDTMGALTAATATGFTILTAVTNVVALCYIDPAAVAAAADGARFVRAVITPSAEVTSTVVGASVRFTPRYAGASIPSST